MHMKVYIFGVEMGQRIHLWHQYSMKITILWYKKGKEKFTFLAHFFFSMAINGLKALKLPKNKCLFF